MTPGLHANKVSREDVIGNYAVEADERAEALEEAAHRYGKFYPKASAIFAFHRDMKPHEAFQLYLIDWEYGWSA